MILSSKLKERNKYLMKEDFKLTTMHCVTGGGLSHDVELEIGTCASSETSVGVHVQFYPNFNVNFIIIFFNAHGQ